MNEYFKQPKESLDKTLELTEIFNNLNESGIAHSITTGELFKSGVEGKETVVQKIKGMNSGHSKDSALFRIAKLYYENDSNIGIALQIADEIQNQDEKTRCLVHLANALITIEGNLDSADSVIEKITVDNKGYEKDYKRVRKEYTDNQ